MSIKFMSGGVNLAAHRLVESALFDFAPPQPWVFFESSSGPSEPRLFEKHRQQFLLHPEAPYGSLLVRVWPASSPRPDARAPKSLRPPVQDIAVAPVAGLRDYQVMRSGTLYLCVNEILADTKEAYVSDLPFYERATEELSKRSRAVPGYLEWVLTQWNGALPTAQQARDRADSLWEAFIKDYPTLWFDDNIGSFLVVLEVSRTAVE